ncbi:MAG: HD domain-containing protein [Dehalococcoidia bacterium]
MTVTMIRDRFGARVARLVADYTDLLPGDRPNRKGPWRARKNGYLAHVAKAPSASVLVSVCDKVHNLGTLVAHVRAEVLGTWTASTALRLSNFGVIRAFSR